MRPVRGSATSDFDFVRSQSAMEYLMTYGWAILIIAVVLGVLFQLGVFNSGNFAPKAKAGQCQIQVVGSGSSMTHQLAGMCSPELPQYVGSFSAGGSYVFIPSNSMIASIEAAKAVTFTAWIYAYLTPSNEIVDDSGNGGFQLAAFSTGAATTMFGGSTWGFNPTTLSTGTWYFLAGTAVSNGAQELYVDGVPVNSMTAGGQVETSTMTIGSLPALPCYYCFYGLISNVQVYNASLSTAEVLALYNEGIGGTPVKPQNLVGWWPLNGDFNDYSGNNDNGQSTNVGFSSTWASTYHGPQ